MSDCCVVPHTGDIPTCPMNGQVTKPVGKEEKGSGLHCFVRVRAPEIITDLAKTKFAVKHEDR